MQYAYLIVHQPKESTRMKDKNHCTMGAFDNMTGYPGLMQGFITVMWHPGVQRMTPVIVPSPQQQAQAARR